ncbi:hypothetical protein [Bradyrhizobium sp. AZCC 2289]|uniref:hypothetical protein n=1 Tax=Bradyrhizobium sp. AZCC 2289 TaxID=3117026 RepID=UPI002FEF8EC6
MTGKYAPPAVTIRSYPDSPICDVVVVVRDQEMILRCRDYRQAMQWARLERKTYKIPEPDTGFPANEESDDRFDLRRHQQAISWRPRSPEGLCERDRC